MSALDRLGVDAAMTQELGLGLKEPYRRADGTRVENVLTYPLTGGEGRRRYAYLNIVDHTVNPEHPVGWGPGRPETISTGTGKLVLVVCASALEVWQIGRVWSAHGGQGTAIASSQAERLPSEWVRREFWSCWGRVLVMNSVSSKMREAVTRAAMRPVDQATGTLVDSGTDLAAMAERLRLMIDQATPQAPIASDLFADLSKVVGDFDTRPISVHGGLAGNRLYYAFTVERRELSTRGRADCVLHRYQTIVLRSDGELLEATTLPAPTGTPAHRRVHSLSDGTRICALPDPGHHASWSLSGIRQFVTARAKGDDPCKIDAGPLAEDAVRCLQASVQLPVPAHYWVLTAFLMAGYLHRVFDALPLIHVHGEKGSGKSELTSKLVELGFNGEMMSQGSASALIRLVRESGGLVAIDDAESLSCGTGEIAQALKSGYKQATATKVVVLPGGRTEAIDFFGPRVVCNTMGLDHVLASRSVRIDTKVGNRLEIATDAHFDVGGWRDAVHAWAMARLPDVQAVYKSVRADVTDRRSEIWAPLRSIALVVGLQDMIAATYAVESACAVK